MDKYRMAGTKLMWHLDKLKDWSEGKPIIPVNIIIGLTSICNLKCIFCYGKEIGQTEIKDRIEISVDEFRELVKASEELGIKSMSIIGEGENTIHSKFDEILDIMIDSTIDFGIATNGVHISNIEKMLNAFVWIRISICASDKELYEKIHGVNSFDNVIKNMKDLVRVRKEKDLDATLGVTVVGLEENVHDSYNIAKLSKDIGFDYFALKPCADTPTKKFDIDYSKISYDEDELRSLGDSNYTVVIKSDKYEAGSEHPYTTCYGTEFAIAINAKGDVAPCPDLLRREEFVIDNIRNSNLKDIICSDRYQSIQEKVKHLNLDTDCESNCCYYHMNQLLEEIKDRKPEHVNFV